MRKITCISLFFLMVFSVQAQDVLTKTSGETVNCEILLESEDALLVKIKLRYGKPAEMQIIKAEIEGFRYEEGIEGSMDSITEGSDVYTNSLEAVKKSSKITTVDLADLSVVYKAVMKKDGTGRRFVEVLFSPEYLSMSNIMFKFGDSDLVKMRTGILFHSSTQRTGLLNQMGQFNIGFQVNKGLSNRSKLYGFLDFVGFNKFESLQIDRVNKIRSIQYSGFGGQLGLGFDVNLNENMYLGVETGFMVPYIEGLSGLAFLLSANSGLRFGIRF
jgi:hypothetical protein